MRDAIAKLNEDFKHRGNPFRDFGIGIHCGSVVHGFIGTRERVEFTVIGDAVDRAGRYCSAAAPGEILISQEMFQHASNFIEAEPRTIESKNEPTLPAYRVNSLKSAAAS
jgi:adenylate cyclase